MFWAIKNNEKLLASPGLKATCPICNQLVLAKCGKIKIWHWCHLSKIDCDDWCEPESEWHKNWKDYFKKENQEVKIDNHRADILTKQGIVIELQNSPLSNKKIIEREDFYGKMLWVLNGESFANNLNITKKKNKKYYTFRWKYPPKSWWDSKKEIYIDLEPLIEIAKNKIFEIEIKGKKYWKNYSEEDYNEHTGETYFTKAGSIDITKDILMDLKSKIFLYEENLFLIKKIYNNLPCGGWGVLVNKYDFLDELGENELNEK